ncbi:MAG TPA: YlbF family regulator, partial [Firmicutes bacterium]|nr:YlbF family regulator [Bacillota bacterium]
MDVYDRAHALARAIRDSEERQKFLIAKQKVA